MNSSRACSTAQHSPTSAISLLVDGFWDNPAWKLIDLHDKHPDAEKFVYRGIAELMASHSYLIYDGDEVIGHACMTPENSSAVPSLWSVVRHAWQLPFKFGMQFTWRLINFMEVMDSPEAYLQPYQPAATLDWFMVKTEWRGRGTEDAVRLYERAGFKTIKTHKIRTKDGRECDNWCMVYDAAAKAY